MDYVHRPLKPIESFALAQWDMEGHTGMQRRNGMTWEVYLNYIILNDFEGLNNLNIKRDENLLYERESVLEVATKCAPYYNRTPKELADSFIDYLETKYLDKDALKEFERMRLEIIERKKKKC